MSEAAYIADTIREGTISSYGEKNPKRSLFSSEIETPLENYQPTEGPCPGYITSSSTSQTALLSLTYLWNIYTYTPTENKTYPMPVLDFLFDLIKQEILEMLHSDEYCNKTTPSSVKYCNTFIEMLELEISDPTTLPFTDQHPDGEVALGWHKDKVGAFSISFTPDGYIHYAGYFPDKTKQPKGRIHFSKRTDLIKYIKKF